MPIPLLGMLGTGLLGAGKLGLAGLGGLGKLGLGAGKLGLESGALGGIGQYFGGKQDRPAEPIYNPYWQAGQSAIPINQMLAMGQIPQAYQPFINQSALQAEGRVQSQIPNLMNQFGRIGQGGGPQQANAIRGMQEASQQAYAQALFNARANWVNQGRQALQGYSQQNPYIGVKPGSKPSLVQSGIGSAQNLGGTLGQFFGKKSGTGQQQPQRPAGVTANALGQGRTQFPQQGGPASIYPQNFINRTPTRRT